MPCKQHLFYIEVNLLSIEINLMSVPAEIALDISNLAQLVEDSCCVVFHKKSDSHLRNDLSFNKII